MTRPLILLAWLTLATAATADTPSYRLYYEMTIDPDAGHARASVRVAQSNAELREVRFEPDERRFHSFEADSGLSREGNGYVWSVPAGGGTLSWVATTTHQRRSERYDARITDDWALFRGEDVFPAMASVARRGAVSRARLSVDAPRGWSVLTPFEEDGERFRFDNPKRRFDRPTGWMIAGKLGVRIDRIGATRVVVAAPVGEPVRRQNMLALLNWTLPPLAQLLPDFPEQLLIVSAGDPFWRGGLSGPASLYLHADRPIISENGTSTLVHELFHVGFGRRAVSGDDWIIEGLAEYYSVALLNRSGTTTDSRRDKTLAMLDRWGREAETLQARRASGPITARAVGVFVTLDEEIRRSSKNKYSLDTAVRALAASDEPLGTEELRREVAKLIGGEPRTLAAL